MTHRERILAALRREGVDRVPIDLGGTESSSVTGEAYNRLKGHLGLPVGCRVVDCTQVVVSVDAEVKDRFDVAAELLYPEPAAWREGRLPDGTPCEWPAPWQTVTRADGTEEVVDAAGCAKLRRAPSGHHFDPVNPALAAVESAAELSRHRETMAAFDWPGYADEGLGAMAARARRLHEQTDRAVVYNFMTHLLAAGQILRGYEQFMMDLVLDQGLAHALLEALLEAYCERADRILPMLGGSIDVILLCDDLGTQEGPMLSPDLYRKMIKPYQRRLIAHLKSRTRAALLLHSCGSVRYAIPDMIEIGVDALNPVQVSAAGMDSAELKREFGRDLTFWGGGCDTQFVLSRGTPAQVREEVKRRMSDFGPEGHVFCQIHNIQPEVPAENVVAMLEAAREFG